MNGLRSWLLAKPMGNHIRRERHSTMVNPRFHLVKVLLAIVCLSYTVLSFATRNRKVLCSNHVLSVATPSELEAMNRSELQKLAKEQGVKANKKSSEIIAELSSIASLNNPILATGKTSSQQTTLQTDLELRRSAQRVLMEQGIEIRDLLDLRQSAMKIQQKYPHNNANPQRTNKELTNANLNINGKSEEKVVKVLKPINKINLKATDKSERNKNYKSGTNDSTNNIKDQHMTTFKSVEKYTKCTSNADSKRAQSLLNAQTPLNKLLLSTQEKEKERHKLLKNVTLKDIIFTLLTPSEAEGFRLLYKTTHIRCFAAEKQPTLSSALQLLRKADMAWARRKVEDLYLQSKLSNLPPA